MVSIALANHSANFHLSYMLLALPSLLHKLYFYENILQDQKIVLRSYSIRNNIWELYDTSRKKPAIAKEIYKTIWDLKKNLKEQVIFLKNLSISWNCPQILR